MSYQSLDYNSAISNGCRTIEDVEEAELLGVLPGGATEELQDYFPTEEEEHLNQALRDYLFVENEYITEAELVESYDYPHLLRYKLSELGTDVSSDFFFSFLPTYNPHE